MMIIFNSTMCGMNLVQVKFLFQFAKLCMIACSSLFCYNRKLYNNDYNNDDKFNSAMCGMNLVQIKFFICKLN